MNVNKERPPQQLLDEAHVVLDIAVYWVEEEFQNVHLEKQLSNVVWMGQCWGRSIQQEGHYRRGGLRQACHVPSAWLGSRFGNEPNT